MNVFDFYRRIEQMVKERDPRLETPNAMDNLRYLKINLTSCLKVLGNEAIDLPVPSWDYREFQTALNAIGDLGNDVIEFGIKNNCERTQKTGWRTRSSSGHLRVLFMALGLEELGKPFFRRVEGTEVKRVDGVGVAKAGGTAS